MATLTSTQNWLWSGTLDASFFNGRVGYTMGLRDASLRDSFNEIGKILLGELLNGCNHLPKFLPFFGEMILDARRDLQESSLVLMAVSIALGLIGPGSYSLDALFGIVQTSALLFGALAVAALLVDVIGLLISRPAGVAPSGSVSRAS